MAIRPIKSLSKVSDQPILRSFKSCREINLQNIFGNLLVSAMEHLIMYLRGYRLQEFFNNIMSKIPQAYSENFQMNYQEIYEDFEELFEKKQLKILNSMIFDSTFINFLVELQELNEVNDCKISQNEKLHMIEYLGNQMRINVMVIHSKGKKTKFYVDDPYVSVTIFEENGLLYILFPYEYKHFEMNDEDSHLEERAEEDLRKNNQSLHLQIEDQLSPNRLSITINSPNLSRLSWNSPNASRASAIRLASPSGSINLQQTESEKRMALRAQLFKQQRKQVLDKSQSKFYEQENEDYSALTRNFSAEDYFLKDKNASIEDFKYFSFKGDFSLDAKDRIRWVKETELIKQEILKREEFRKLESTFIAEEAKLLENKRQEIDRIVEEKRKFFEAKRISEEKRLEEHRRKLNETRSKRVQEVRIDVVPKEELLAKRALDEAALLEEKRLAELEIQEAEKKLKQALESYEAQKLVEEQRLAEEQERRIEEEKVMAEERRREEERQEMVRKALEAQKQIELEARLEQERKNNEERIRKERERKAQEDKERKAQEERERKEQEERERKEQEDREIEEERLRIEEEERKAEQEKKLEEERIAKEQLKAQRLQEAKRKRAQEEEENMKLAREKEAERKRITDEKKRAELERKENEAKRKQEELEQQRIEDAKKKKIEDDKRAAEEKKRKEEEKRLADEKKKKEEEKRLADEKKRKEEEKRLADEKKRKAEEAKKQVVEETYEESDNKSFCGGLYCAKCARELKRSNYLLKCDQCNDRYLRTHTSSFPPAPSVPSLKSCMECGAKITKGEEISCIRCFLQTKIFHEESSPCTSCVQASKCYWIDASVGEDNQMVLCGFCGEYKVKESTIIVCTGCNDMICLICLRKNTYVVEGICSNCHIRREPSLC